MTRTALIELYVDVDVTMKGIHYQDVILTGGRGYLISEQEFERWFALNDEMNFLMNVPVINLLLF